MKKEDALQAFPIVDRAMTNLLMTVPLAGRVGVDARVAIGEVKAFGYDWMRQDILGPHLADAFSTTREAGATLAQLESVRKSIANETPALLGSIMTRDVLIYLTLATEGQVIAGMTFISRQDIDAVKITMNAAFQDPEEAAADAMDSASFQALITLHAAITNHLVTTARPLPRMMNYQFARVYPSLILAHRLYADPSRADEIRAENKIVHPAFCPLQGVALSS